MAQIQLRDPNGAGIGRVNVAICEGKDQPFENFIFHVTTDAAGNQTWPIPHWPNNIEYTFHINMIDPDPRFQTKAVNVPLPTLPGGGYGDVEIVVPFVEAPPVPAVDMGRLRVDGPLLRLSDGTPWRWKLVTAFDAVRLVSVKDWDRLKTYAKWTRVVGGNGWRMFGGWSRTKFDYREVPDYFTRVLPDLNSFLRDEGLRGEFVAVTDSIPSTDAEQRSFLMQCLTLMGEHMFFQYANEPWKNGLDPQHFTIASQVVLTSKGAPEAGTSPYPYIPTMGYSTHHPPRDDEWFRKAGKDSYEIRQTTGGVVIPDEQIGYAEQSKGGSRSSDVRKAFLSGVGMGMFCPGGTAHGDSDTMQLCNVPGPIEEQCVREQFRGIDLVPAMAPTWRYGRYGDSAPPTSMPIEDDDPVNGRIHAMVNVSQAVALNYFAAPGWVAKPRDGWRIVTQDGGAVILER